MTGYLDVADKQRRRPLLAVSAWLERAQWSHVEADAVIVEASFISKLNASGADAVVVPVQSDISGRLIDLIDGIVLTGGPDVGPANYGSEGGQTPFHWEARDRAELALAQAALEGDIPILAVCRGCQVLNVAAGGTLVEHVPEQFEGVVHQLGDEARASYEFAAHDVRASPSTPLSRALGEHFEVLSSHHQAVDDLGAGLRAAAWSDDGLIEAYYSPAHRFLVGVQWHPEAGDSGELFEALVEAARLGRSIGADPAAHTPASVGLRLREPGMP